MWNEATIPVRDWLERLALDTGAFRLASLSTEPFHGPDYIAEIDVPTTKSRLTLIIEVKTRVTPQIAYSAVQLLRKFLANSLEGIPLLCAPYISMRSAEICQEEGVSFLDGAGNCLLSGPGLFVRVTGKPNPRPDTRKAVNPFATKSSRVARTLLSDPKRSWFVKDLAAESGISMGLVSKVKNALIEEALVENREGQLRVRDPHALLEAWASVYEPPAEAVPSYIMARPGRLEEDIAAACDKAGIDYALTGFAAAWRLSPMVRYQQPSVYIKLKRSSISSVTLLSRLGFKPVESGANLVALFTDDPGPLTGAQIIDGLRVVSPLQAYLDLAKKPGRGEEAATSLFEKYIAPEFMKTEAGGRGE